MISVCLKWRAAKVDLPAPEGPMRRINDGSGIWSRNNLFARGGAAHFQARRLGVRHHLSIDFSGRLAGRIESRIADALVVDIDQRVDEAFANSRQFAHGDGAFVELAVGDYVVNDLFDNRADVFWSVLFKRTDRGLGAVGEHQDDRLLGLRLRAGITKIVNIDGIAARFGLRLGFVIE